MEQIKIIRGALKDLEWLKCINAAEPTATSGSWFERGLSVDKLTIRKSQEAIQKLAKLGQPTECKEHNGWCICEQPTVNEALIKRLKIAETIADKQIAHIYNSPSYDGAFINWEQVVEDYSNCRKLLNGCIKNLSQVKPSCDHIAVISGKGVRCGKCEAFMEQQVKPSVWQPISEVPRDTFVLGYYKLANVYAVVQQPYSDDDFKDLHGAQVYSPDFFISLPAAPDSEGK